MPAHDPCAVGATFRSALDAFDTARPVLVLGHVDADGLAAAAILARALARTGRAVDIRLVGKGENAWSDALRGELRQRRPGGLILADLGVRAGAVLPGVSTILIDHHVPTGTPEGAAVISGHGMTPEPSSALLAYWCAHGIARADDFLWLAALGLIGDMAAEAGFPELAEAQARYGKTALREAVALVNAPRRTAAADARPALALLMTCTGPRELVAGGHPETAALRAARAEVQRELAAARRVPPKIRGAVALIRVSSPCQIHPLLAQQWRGRLKNKIVLAANTGYRQGWIHFAARTAMATDLVRFLAERRPDGADETYGSGHRQATGGALRPAAWNAFVAALGFPEEQIA